MGPLGRSERCIELAQGEVHLGQCVPRFKRLRGRSGGAREFCQRSIAFAEGIVGRCIFDERLKFVAGHGRSVFARGEKGRPALRMGFRVFAAEVRGCASQVPSILSDFVGPALAAGPLRDERDNGDGVPASDSTTTRRELGCAQRTVVRSSLLRR